MIIFNKILFEISYFNEPSRYSFVNQRCITSPTIGIVMDLSTGLNNSSFIFNIFNNYFISIFYINAFIYRAFVCKFTILVNWNWRIIRGNDVFSNANFIIFLTEPWSAMYDTSTRIISNEISSNNFETTIFLSINKKLKHWHVLFSFQIFTFEFIKNFKCLLIFSIKSFCSAFC
jgi:hypothetical protein